MYKLAGVIWNDDGTLATLDNKEVSDPLTDVLKGDENKSNSPDNEGIKVEPTPLEALNDFLLTLSTNYLEENLPMLQAIQYVGEVKSTEDKKTINFNSKIIAAVQYFVYVK